MRNPHKARQIGMTIGVTELKHTIGLPRPTTDCAGLIRQVAHYLPTADSFGRGLGVLDERPVTLRKDNNTFIHRVVAVGGGMFLVRLFLSHRTNRNRT